MWIFGLLKVILICIRNITVQTCRNKLLAKSFVYLTSKFCFLCSFSSENSPLSSLHYPFNPRSSDGRTVTSGSLAPSLSTRSNPDHLKRISYSEVALNKAPSGPILAHDELRFPGFNPMASAGLSNPRIMSRSHHNLGQMPESPEHRLAEADHGQAHGGLIKPQPNQVSSHFQQHQRASSDTDSLSQQQDK